MERALNTVIQNSLLFHQNFNCHALPLVKVTILYPDPDPYQGFFPHLNEILPYNSKHLRNLFLHLMED